MSRTLEIVMAAEKYREKYRKCASYMGENDFFIAGAKWADKHPFKKGIWIHLSKTSIILLFAICVVLLAAMIIAL